MSEPWKNEPNRKEWRHAGFPCLIVRSHLGALCGYVGVPPGHPLFGDVERASGLLSVHGGVTYGGTCRGPICHKPLPGEAEVFWFGFDCAHAWDVVPGLVELMTSVERDLGLWGVQRPTFQESRSTYKDLAWVTREVEQLAEQLRDLAEQLSDLASSTSTPQPSTFRCPRCERESSHPEDARHRYCGACKEFFLGTEGLDAG
jgi:hypothetical protein